MSNPAIIGIDLGKNCFHLHGQDHHGQELFRKKFNRSGLYKFLIALAPCTLH
ncbi:hypothetical protein SAMN05660489_06167, partial [Pseudomonas sp. LAMO17WK12:I10]